MDVARDYKSLQGSDFVVRGEGANVLKQSEALCTVWIRETDQEAD